MIESEIVAPGSMKSVLSGKHYNRSIRAHKIIYEAMQRLRLEAFEKSLPTKEKAVLESIKLNMMQDYYKTDTFWAMTNGDDVTEMVHNMKSSCRSEVRRIHCSHFGRSTLKWCNFCCYLQGLLGRRTGSSI